MGGKPSDDGTRRWVQTRLLESVKNEVFRVDLVFHSIIVPLMAVGY